MIDDSALWHFAPDSISWTDAVTNRTLLSGLALDRYVTWLGKRRLTIDPVVPTFIHEATHHWCFDTTVGGAIALLELQAKRDAFATECRTWSDEYRVFDYLLRSSVAAVLLRPFAEGLALFAEYDVVPQDSPQISTPMLAMQCCFGLPVSTADDGLFSWKATLQATRRNAEFCKRKASVLQRPFSCDDSYLPGYMAVKTLYSSALRRHGRFSDKDLFLSFARHFFYSDVRFAATILDWNIKEVQLAKAITNYFFQRVNMFLAADLDPLIDEYLELVRTRNLPMTFERAALGLGVTPEDVTLCNERLQVIWAAKYERTLDAFVTNNLTTLRKCMHVGSMSAAIKNVTADVLGIFAAETHLMDCNAACSEVEGSEGTLTIIWDPDALFLGIFFVTDRGCTLVNSFPKDSSKGDRARAVAQFSALSDRIRDHIDDHLENVFSKSSVLQHELSRMRAETMRNAQSLYGELATLTAEESKRERLLQELAPAGLAGLLDYESELVLALAAVGIANTMSSRRGDVEFILNTMGVSVESKERLLQSGQNVHGLPLLVADHRFMLALF